jgi:hypothetical protein
MVMSLLLLFCAATAAMFCAAATAAKMSGKNCWSFILRNSASVTKKGERGDFGGFDRLVRQAVPLSDVLPPGTAASALSVSQHGANGLRAACYW